MSFKENVNDLKPHPRNAEFFDDITGDKWTEFLESIKTLGVIEPIIITQNRVIVSGHQRVRACKELGILEIECILKNYDNEDAVLLDLIETNIRQRGDVGGSAQKVGRRIKELERIYGVRQGSSGSTKSGSHTETEIANELGISKDTYAKYKSLANMIPELSDAVDSGRVTKASALAMMKQLSEDEQIELLSSLDATKKYTQKETEALINEIAELKAEPPKVVEKVVEKVPDDYQLIQKERDSARQERDTIRSELNGVKAERDRVSMEARGWQNDYNRERGELEKKNAELSKANDKIKAFEEADNGIKRKKHQIETGEMFNARVTRFIEEVAGYVWLTDEINELPDKDRDMFIRSVQKIKEWAGQMEYNINSKLKEE